MTETFTVLGDSHARLFLVKPLHLRRLGLSPDGLAVTGQAISAASLAGFRKASSTLDTRAIIAPHVAAARHLVLAFGQVDLELGYYYRLLIKGEAITPDAYADWLVGIARDFVTGIAIPRDRLALKGANLTVLTHPLFFARYVARIISGETGARRNEERLAGVILGEDGQNAMHLRFNAGLRDLAADLGCRYFDINADIVLPGAHPPRVPEAFQPGPIDHHLADSLLVRRAHLHRMLEAFDFNMESFS